MAHLYHSVNVGDAVGQKLMFACPSLFISHICGFAFTIWLMVIPWYYLFYDLLPQFSIQVDHRGLDMSSTTAIASALHIALHASNESATERCYHNGEAAVIYGGFTISSGRVPAFWVQGQQEVPFLTHEEGVGLPQHLRNRMVSEHKIGALEFEVQVRLLHAGSPIRMSCNVRMSRAQQPSPDEAMCTIFALQNWFDYNA